MLYRGGRRQAEADLEAESGAVKRWARGRRRAGGQAFPQLTCRPLRAPPRRSARPFRRPGLQLDRPRPGLSDRGLRLRLRSRPGSGTGAPGTGARGSGAGPGSATASPPSTDSSSGSSQPIILGCLQGCGVAGAQGSGNTDSPPPLPNPSKTALPKTVSARPALLVRLSVISVAPLPASRKASAHKALPRPQAGVLELKPLEALRVLIRTIFI